MKNIVINNVDDERLKKLKELGIDSESIEEFKKSIEEVDEFEADLLGERLYKDCGKMSIKHQEYLIQQGANLNYRSPKKGDFLLLKSARRNYFDLFLLCIKAGCDVNECNKYGTTPTMTSARHGNDKILELCILLGADINAQCKDGDTALMSAKRHNQVKCFEMLKQANAQFGIKNNLNQTVQEIPVQDNGSEEDIDLSGFLCFEDSLPALPQDAIEDAKNKMEQFKIESADSSKTLVKKK